MSSQVTVVPVFDFEQVDCTKNSEVHLDVVLSAPEKADEKRIPLHLSLAIDCSGSMDRGKLTSVKRTVNTLIDHLTENDSLSIVGFSTNVFDVLNTMPMTQSNKELAKGKVNGLHTMSATNLSQAIVMASERAATSEKDKVSRIIILTDGLPSAGVRDKGELIKMCGDVSASLSTFGYGDDYDPELLVSMSNMGRGNNFYIEKDEDCRGAFALELGGLLSLYAQDLQITVTPSGNMVIEEFMSGYVYEQTPGYRGITEGKLSYTVDDIYVGEKKHALIRFSVPKASDAVCARKTSFCTIEVDYLDVETKERKTAQTTAKIQYVKAGKAPKNSNDEVKKQLALVEVAKIQKEAKEKADAGLYEEARAAATRGHDFALDNAFLDQNAVVAQNFAHMGEAMSNRFDYQTKGLKLAMSYSSGMARGRAATLDSVGATYTSALQQNLMRSFNDAEEISGTTSSGDALLDISGSSSGVSLTSSNGTGEDEDEKA